MVLVVVLYVSLIHTSNPFMTSMPISNSTMQTSESNSTTETLTPIANASLQTTKSNFVLAFFLQFGNPYYNDNLSILAKNLKAGDYLLVESTYLRTPELFQTVHDAKALVKPGVKVISVVNYKDIESLSTTAPLLPKGIDYIMYDYEPGASFSPEFTKNESVSISYFEQAKDSVEQYNKNTGSDAKLFLTPPFGQLRNADWNWGLLSKHVDVIDMQLQAFLKDPSLKTYATDIIEQIRKDSPDKLVFMQCSLSPQRGTVQDNVNAVETLRQIKGINGSLVFYQNVQGPELEQFFSLLDR